MTDKEKCERLKQIRKEVADRLGIKLYQEECTYEGECIETCPACKEEEKILNKELLNKSNSENIFKLPKVETNEKLEEDIDWENLTPINTFLNDNIDNSQNMRRGQIVPPSISNNNIESSDKINTSENNDTSVTENSNNNLNFEKDWDKLIDNVENIFQDSIEEIDEDNKKE